MYPNIPTPFDIQEDLDSENSQYAFSPLKPIAKSLPTGCGKSLISSMQCYPLSLTKSKLGTCKHDAEHVLIVLLLHGEDGSIVICISLLTAVMVDQRDKLKAKNVNVEFVGEAQMDYSVKDKVIQGKIELAFISPESILCNLSYRNMLRSSVCKHNLLAIAVDEPHCVKTW